MKWIACPIVLFLSSVTTPRLQLRVIPTKHQNPDPPISSISSNDPALCVFCTLNFGVLFSFFHIKVLLM